MMRRVAGALAGRGIGEGDRVVFSLPNSAALLAAMVGVLRAGVVAVPLNPALVPAEREPLLADSEPSLVVDSSELLAELLEGPEIDLAPFPRSRPMHYTSGTTGRPKGVWSGLLDGGDSAALLDEEADLWS